LPYDRVDHLATLQEYFDVLDIEGVSELTDGTGSPPADNLQVFLGSLGLLLQYIEPTVNPHLLSTLDQHLSPLLTISNMNNNTSTPLFCTLGNGRFAMPDKYRPGMTLLITLDQICLYLQHDTDLRGGVSTTTIPSPIGYDEFMVALNSNEDNGIQVALVLEDNTSVRIQGQPPTLAKLIGLEAIHCTNPTICDPKEEAGGRWLDPCCSELMDEVLWDNLDRCRD
jgi:hypothetical protein